MAKRTGTDHVYSRWPLVGYEAEIGKINAAIAHIRARIGQHSDGQPAPKKRSLSAAARRLIAAAQRKGWAAQPKAKKTTSTSLLYLTPLTMPYIPQNAGR
jgi:hypothetical protein